MRIQKSYAINIENELRIIEKIFDKYISDPEYALFLPNKRLPIEPTIDLKKINVRDIRNFKYLSYKCIGFFTAQLLNFLYMNSIDPSIYHTNEMLKCIAPKKFVDMYRHEIADIIYDYLPNITTEELHVIYDVTEIVNSMALKHVKPDHDFIFEIDYESNFIVLIIVDSIWHFRFKECVEDENYRKEIADE